MSHQECATGGRRSITLSYAFVILVLLIANPTEALSVAADVWSDEEVDGSGNFVMYGRGVANTSYGWVQVSAHLKAPSGAGLDWNWNEGFGSATVDVAATLNVNSMESGEYQTTVQGMDEQQTAGCSSAGLNVSPYFTRWWRFGFDNTDQCDDRWAYFVDCTGTCAGESYLCSDTNQGTWIQGVGLKITVYSVPWCTPSTKQGSESAFCYLP